MAVATLADFVQEFLRDFLADPDNNNLGSSPAEKAWQDFALGYSRGDDELYAFWKEHIGEFHWTPGEAFALGMSAEGLESPAAARATAATPAAVPPEELTVISWALSHTEVTKADNRGQRKMPSERWARSRVFGQSRSRALHRALVKALAERGHSAVAPALLPQFGERESALQGRASAWSERHVAYTSGLGTFGLSGGLITPLGSAVRLGSVVVRAQIPPTSRAYSGGFDYCLYFNGGGCAACVDRCPAGSIGEDDRDKPACARHLEVVTAEFVEREYGFEGYGCGLCQTGVPCESAIPTRPAG
jgi:epoxyqueuosine reductase